MPGSRLFRIVEGHSDQLATALVKKLHTSGRTTEFRKIPEHELLSAAKQVYANLGDWLLTKTDSDIELRYKELGVRRATQGIPFSQLMWALLLSKEELWSFLQREGFSDRALELYDELEFISLLDHFFDNALYYVAASYEQQKQASTQRAA